MPPAGAGAFARGSLLVRTMVHRASRMGEGECSAEKRSRDRCFRRLIYFVLLVKRKWCRDRRLGTEGPSGREGASDRRDRESRRRQPGRRGKIPRRRRRRPAQQEEGPDFRRAGVYQVTINKVELAQALFKPGHTVDIQAKVTKRDARGQDTVVWESRQFGERLAVVGKDALDRGLAQSPVPG